VRATNVPKAARLTARATGSGPAEVELVRVATGVDLNVLALKGALGDSIELDELLQRSQAA
jgi:hypothetical protein